jgi:hypothetical protein
LGKGEVGKREREKKREREIVARSINLYSWCLTGTKMSAPIDRVWSELGSNYGRRNRFISVVLAAIQWE